MNNYSELSLEELETELSEQKAYLDLITTSTPNTNKYRNFKATQIAEVNKAISELERLIFEKKASSGGRRRRTRRRQHSRRRRTVSRR